MGRAVPAMAGAISVSASSDPRGLLRHGASLVRPLRDAQSRFSAHIYLAAQFRALSHPGFRAPPAILVFWPDILSGDSSVAAGVIHRCFGRGHAISFERAKNSPALFVAGWALFTLLFFSLSQSKLPGYILPAIPAVLLLPVVSVRQIRAECTKESAAIVLVSSELLISSLAGIVACGRTQCSQSRTTLHANDHIRGFEVALGAAMAGGLA